MRYVRQGQQSSRRTGDSQLALKSGTVTPSGGFTAHLDGFEAEFMDKPYPPRSISSRQQVLCRGLEWGLPHRDDRRASSGEFRLGNVPHPELVAIVRWLPR